MRKPIDASEDRYARIAELLLRNRDGATDWGEFAQPDCKPWSKKTANKFLLCCLLDYQTDSDRAWDNGYHLVKDILRDPDDVWSAITSIPQAEWQAKYNVYRLHRFPAGHNRLHTIGKRICDEYGGDAGCIWKGKDARSVLEALLRLGAGPQISRMIVGALRDCGELEAAASDVKGDVYVCRVLGRALLGEQTDSETAVQLAARLHAADPWLLDAPLWQLGKKCCHATNPRCPNCYLGPHCAYRLRLSAISPTNMNNESKYQTAATKPVAVEQATPTITEEQVRKWIDEAIQAKLDVLRRAAKPAGRNARRLYQVIVAGKNVGEQMAWPRAERLAQELYAASEGRLEIVCLETKGKMEGHRWKFNERFNGDTGIATPRPYRLELLKAAGKEILANAGIEIPPAAQPKTHNV